MGEVLIRQTLPGDAEQLANNLRASDESEVRAYGHNDLTLACQRSVARSMLC